MLEGSGTLLLLCTAGGGGGGSMNELLRGLRTVISPQAASGALT